MDLIRIILSQNLIELRKARGLTQVELANMIQVTHSTYNTWENGAWPSSAGLEKLAAFYGVRSSRFFYDPTLDLAGNPPATIISYDDKLKQLDEHTRDHLQSLIDGLLKK
jgi:transcriptional regulator with XRE-family HTH domain